MNTHIETGNWKPLQWSCHAATTVAVHKNTIVIPIAECAGMGCSTDMAIANAEFISRAANEHAALCAVAEAAKEFVFGKIPEHALLEKFAALAAIRGGGM